MPDFNKILTPGDVKNGIINVVVEIPVGSNNKIEWQREKAVFKLDRIEPDIFPEPTNYGFIPQTLDEDGDELDVLVISEKPIPTGSILKAKIIGIMKFEDSGKVDDKIVVIPTKNLHDKGLSNLHIGISQQKIDQITKYFNHYKDFEKLNSTIVKGWSDENSAKKIIIESIKRWNSQ